MTQVQSPAPMSGGLQPPKTPVPGGPTLLASSATCTHVHNPHEDTHLNIIKNNKNKSQNNKNYYPTGKSSEKLCPRLQPSHKTEMQNGRAVSNHSRPCREPRFALLSSAYLLHCSVSQLNSNHKAPKDPRAERRLLQDPHK